MYLLSLIFLIPSLVIAYSGLRWLYYKEKSKQKRVHKTKIALWLLLPVFLFAYGIHAYGFSVIQKESGQPFWINALTYYLAVSIICAYMFMIVKGTNSRKNITKFIISILLLVVFIPTAYWSYNVFSTGAYNGKFGVSKKAAAKRTEAYIGSAVNHVVNKVTKNGDSWIILVTEHTLDGTLGVDTRYKVNIANGDVVSDMGDKEVKLNITREGGSLLDQGEMLLFTDVTQSSDKTLKLAKQQYAITNGKGEARVFINSNSKDSYVLQVRDCTFSCQDFYFRFKTPVQSEYSIGLDSFIPGIREL